MQQPEENRVDEQDLFLVADPAEIINKTEKIFICIPDLTGKKLVDAAWIALNVWTKAAITNWKSEAEQRLDLFGNANNNNCHALLAQFLYGKGDCGLKSLKYLLLSQLMASAAKNNTDSKHEIELVRNALTNFLCNELQHLKVQYKKDGQTAVLFLDKRKITQESVSKAYARYAVYVDEIMPLVNGENYRMRFRHLVCNCDRYYASPAVAEVFGIAGQDIMKLIYEQLHNHLLYQDISDPYADIHVLTPAYWQLVCQELESFCNISKDREILAKIKKNMIVLNEADAEWLYFPTESMRRKLNNAINVFLKSSRYPDISKVELTIRLFDVLDKRSVMLDEKSLQSLRKQENRFKALYENACMNNLDNLVAQLKPYLGAIKPCIHPKDKIFRIGKTYNELFKFDNPKKLCMFLGADLIGRGELLNWVGQANLYSHIRIMQLLIAYCKPSSEYIYENMVLACDRSNLNIIKILAPSLPSWSFKDIYNRLAGSKRNTDLDYLQLELAFILSVCKGLVLRDKYSFNTVNPITNKTLQQEMDIMKHKVAINKYAFFASQLPLPKELQNHILHALAGVVDCSELTKKELTAIMPMPDPEERSSNEVVNNFYVVD